MDTAMRVFGDYYYPLYGPRQCRRMFDTLMVRVPGPAGMGIPELPGEAPIYSAIESSELT